MIRKDNVMNIQFVKKCRKTYSLIKNKSSIVNGGSYYPDCKHKSKNQILKDQLFFIWKYGSHEPFYYTYGFDRLEMSRERMTNEYLIPYDSFQAKINYLNNHNPNFMYTSRVITADKFYFNIFLERFGIPTPPLYCYIKDHQMLYCDARFEIDAKQNVNQQLKQLFSYDMDAFCKPSSGQLGNGIFVLKVEDSKVFVDGKLFDIEKLIEILLSANYLIQKRIYQHPIMNTLCDSTINSIRMQTVMTKDGKVIPFGAGLRMGRKGSSVDNWAKGGVFVGIDMEKGTLMEMGFLKPKYGTSTKEHPDTHIVFKDFEIPYYKEAERMAVELHKRLYRCHSVGWDIGITEDGPMFIEGNGLWEISLIQAAHGGLKKQIENFFSV